MSRLKVYGIYTYVIGQTKQVRAIIAESSQVRAAKALDVPLHYFRANASETSNEHEINTATSDPGAVFYRPMGSGKYIKIER